MRNKDERIPQNGIENYAREKGTENQGEKKEDGNMKKLMLIVMMLFLSGYAVAQEAVVLIGASEGADGYMLYYSAESETTWSYNTGLNLEVPISVLNLTPGVDYTFWAKAYNKAGESEKSEEKVYETPEYIPVEVRKTETFTVPGPVTITVIVTTSE